MSESQENEYELQPVHHEVGPSYPVLSPEALAILEERDPGCTVVQDGKRKISSANWFPKGSIDPEDAVLVDIPRHLESRGAVEFFGLRSNVADELVTRWEEATAEDMVGPYDLFDWVKSRVDHHTPPVDKGIGSDAEWVGTMFRSGMNEEFIDRIMRPEWRAWRLRGSAKDWIRLMIEDRYQFLQNLDAVIRTPSRGVSCPTTSYRPYESLCGSPSQNATPTQESLQDDGPDNTSITGSHDNVEDWTEDFLEDWPDHLPTVGPDDFVALYKCGSIARLTKIFGFDGLLDVGSGHLRSNAPSDFWLWDYAIYFWTEREAAWEFSQWHAQVVDYGVVPIGIMTIDVPRGILTPRLTFSGDNWRNFVWENQQRKPLRSDKYEGIIRKVAWLHGPICWQTHACLKSKSSEKEVQPWRLCNGNIAGQISTINNDVFDKLDEQCRNRVRIEAIDLRITTF